MQMNSLQPTSYLKEGQGEKIAPLNRMENIAATLFYAINFLSITLTLLFLIESIRNAWFWNEGPPGVVPLLTLMDHVSCPLLRPEVWIRRWFGHTFMIEYQKRANVSSATCLHWMVYWVFLDAESCPCVLLIALRWGWWAYMYYHDQ